MDYVGYEENPFKFQISFHKVIESLEKIALTDVDYRANYAKALLTEIQPFPELRDGLRSLEEIEKHSKLIKYLLADLFPTALTLNEIKAVSIPFQNIVFNYTDRFANILKEAGTDFDITIRDFNDDQFYIMSCCLILNSFYGQHFDFKKPLYYDIPDKAGVIRHYKILYNADFIDILPTDKSKEITSEDIRLLMDSYDNIALWKEKFPVGSWVMKGFGIVTLIDTTVESAISNLKTNLLVGPDAADAEYMPQDFETIFRSIFNIADLRTGFTTFNQEDDTFSAAAFNSNIHSYILSNEVAVDCKTALCGCSFETLIENKKYFAISDVEEFFEGGENETLAKHLLKQNVRSCIMAPVMKNDKLLGVLELVSSRPKELNSLNANKLDIVMPYIVDTINRYYSDLQNQVEAVIQKEYTTIHPSVYWKFRKEGSQYVNNLANGQDYILREIVFPEVYPLYGQIDIKGSSDTRNETTLSDISTQIKLLLAIFDKGNEECQLPIFEQKRFELSRLLEELNLQFKADTELSIQNYIKTEINPIIKHFQSEDVTIKQMIEDYFSRLDENLETIYESRKKFDTTLSFINKKLAAILDQKQREAQEYYPHYYERFKTDGVEHNLYIGDSIAQDQKFDKLYLYNLRLWQLQTMCEMENQYYYLKPTLPYQLDVTSLILVFNSPISIRFRMDEKRFDVDGSYNARYEVVKKRIDKAHVKDSDERITEKGKITIVYSQHSEELEYIRYIQFLQFKNIVGPDIEMLEVEDLQGVSGLKAIRISVLFNETAQNQKTYSYQDLLREISID
ncbi:GAF domain-containing protein [Flavobacterium sp. '19STA2R22 D10 B1']|uniref:GAF domain-containing protein n=1 Tax=Flavobacterium aerium TaxID=3037261 RepID=UPI00278C8AA6|nr:GAF domain-containing protein [Flavobacterium sp. '19STA2R22 D10 B1']